MLKSGIRQISDLTKVGGFLVLDIQQIFAKQLVSSIDV